MPEKYHIAVKPTPSRFPSVGKTTVLDWGEGCLRCTHCVKETCPYNAFRQRDFDDRTLSDTIDTYCKNCLRCVQGCPRELVVKAANPQYRRLGDDYWTPAVIQSTWYQAESGKIPVSGAGYGGPFAGPGFDGIWTDMSEIVRPTRDGIHGREYISTAIDLGRKPLFLIFDQDGNLAFRPPPLLEIPLPILFAEPPFSAGPGLVRQAIVAAARSLNTLAVVPRENISSELAREPHHLAVAFTSDDFDPQDALLSRVRMAEFTDHETVLEKVEAVKKRFPGCITAVKVPADGKAAPRVSQLAQAGAEIIHLFCDHHARGFLEAQNHHLKDLIRRCHLRLVEDNLRDTVTLLASGGIAMAEHVAKAIICGADGVVIDLPLLLALECRLCRACQRGGECPVALDSLDPKRGSQRQMNLMAAWNNQLLEVLGAMGLREVRRLRGEVGRAMFVDDLQREIFAPLFSRPTPEGNRREGE
jgi:ferredoxin